LRRLAALGAVGFKTGLYVLPWSEAHYEQCLWLAGEVEQGGGEAVFFECDAIAAMTEAAVIAAFHRVRDEAYGLLADETRAVLAAADGQDGDKEPAAKLRRLTRRYEAEQAIDFFHAPKGPAVAELLAALNARLTGGTAAGDADIPRRDPADFQGRVWLTRPGLYVDRLAAFWLVRRFIDPAAAIAYVSPDLPPPPDAVAFDMADAPFAHVGSRITFEVMRAAFGLTDQIPDRLAAVLRAVDLGDFQAAPPETAGVKRLLDGLCAAAPDDAARLDQGFALLDALAASYQQSSEGHTHA